MYQHLKTDIDAGKPKSYVLEMFRILQQNNRVLRARTHYSTRRRSRSPRQAQNGLNAVNWMAGFFGMPG